MKSTSERNERERETTWRLWWDSDKCSGRAGCCLFPDMWMYHSFRHTLVLTAFDGQFERAGMTVIISGGHVRHIWNESTPTNSCESVSAEILSGESQCAAKRKKTYEGKHGKLPSFKYLVKPFTDLNRMVTVKSYLLLLLSCCTCLFKLNWWSVEGMSIFPWAFNRDIITKIAF